MAILLGRFVLLGDMKGIIDTCLWNGMFSKKEILAASGTPDTYTYSFFETFNAAAGDNSTVNTGSTTSTYNVGPKTYSSTSNTLVQTTLIITAPSNIKGVFLTANKTLGASTSITYDISIDNAANYYWTAQALDAFIDTTAHTGTQLILKINLNSAGNTVTLSDYGVIILDRKSVV